MVKPTVELRIDLAQQALRIVKAQPAQPIHQHEDQIAYFLRARLIRTCLQYFMPILP